MLRRLASLEKGKRPEDALRTLSGAAFDRGMAQAAARGIRRLQKKQKLGRGLSVEDRINEGREH